MNLAAPWLGRSALARLALALALGIGRRIHMVIVPITGYSIEPYQYVVHVTHTPLVHPLPFWLKCTESFVPTPLLIILKLRRDCRAAVNRPVATVSYRGTFRGRKHPLVVCSSRFAGAYHYRPGEPWLVPLFG